MATEVRKNQSGNLEIEGEWRSPEFPRDVKLALDHAARRKMSVRPMGGMFSTSPLLLPPPGALILDLSKLKLGALRGSTGTDPGVRLLLDPGYPSDRFRFGSPDDRRRHIEVAGGTTVDALNGFLKNSFLALKIMGAFSGQTFIGAMQTSTHGSSAQFGVLADFVKSVELLTLVETSTGETQTVQLRIEPSDGISNPHYVEPGVRLVQDDALFNAVLVSGGFFGVVLAVIVETCNLFDLTVERIHETWTETRKRLIDCGADRIPNSFKRSENVHCYGITLTPFLDLKRERMPSVVSIGTRARPGGPVRQPEEVAVWPLLPTLLNGHVDPDRLRAGIGRIVTEALSKSGEGMPFRSTSHQMLATNKKFPLNGVGVEYVFPMDGDGSYLNAIDALLDLVENAAQRRMVLAGFFSIRMFGPSRAWLALSNDAQRRNWCSVEVLMASDFGCRHALIDELEETAHRFGGRPHWGQVFALSNAHGVPVDDRLRRIRALYGSSLSKWADARAGLRVSDLFLNAVGRALLDRS